VSEPSSKSAVVQVYRKLDIFAWSQTNLFITWIRNYWKIFF